MTIERCAYGDVAHFQSRAAREGAVVKDSRNTIWFRAVDSQGLVVGCAGLLLRSGIGRLKAVYVLPARRREGFGEALTLARIEAAVDEGCSMVEAYSQRPDWYLRNGFRVLSTRANGSLHVARNL